jgi:endogenous inhibitor of DNA gyrase (YacG/DUF329 family)
MILNNKPKVKCPICQKKDTWHQDNYYKPFCSDRCKLIDLGEWANESRKVASEPIDLLTDSIEFI